MKKGDVVMTERPCRSHAGREIEAARIFEVQDVECARAVGMEDAPRVHVNDERGVFAPWRYCLPRAALTVLSVLAVVVACYAPTEPPSPTYTARCMDGWGAVVYERDDVRYYSSPGWGKAWVFHRGGWWDGWDWIDMDKDVVQAAGCTVTEL